MATPWREIKEERRRRIEEQEILDGTRKLPRKFRPYDGVMLICFLLAIVALFGALAMGCGGGQKCWTAINGNGPPSGDNNCKRGQ